MSLRAFATAIVALAAIAAALAPDAAIDWETFQLSSSLSSSARTYSMGFRSRAYNFTCPSVHCPSTAARDVMYMHAIAGVEHRSSFPLLVHRVCEALMWCIPPARFYIVLQTPVEPAQAAVDARVLYRPRPRHPPAAVAAAAADDTTTSQQQQRAVVDRGVRFLTAVGVVPTLWEGAFTSDNKMMRTLTTLRHLNDSDSFIYHADLDEFPDRRRLAHALTELRAGTCDVIVGFWRDRVTRVGHPAEVTLAGPLAEQFPMACQFSSKFMPRRTTQKTLVYRASLRASSGQHSVWCDVFSGGTRRKSSSASGAGANRRGATLGAGAEDPGPGDRRRLAASRPRARRPPAEAWNQTKACMRHLAMRADKSAPARAILSLLPTHRRKPRQCRTRVPIDHYKFVSGVEMYLFKRAVHYKRLGLGWWRQSYEIIDHMRQHGGRICVECPEMNCTLASAADDAPSGKSSPRRTWN